MATLDDIDLPNFSISGCEENVDFASKENTKTDKNPTRFASLSESELQNILAEKQSASTKKTTNWCVSTFKGMAVYNYHKIMKCK